MFAQLAGSMGMVLVNTGPVGRCSLTCFSWAFLKVSGAPVAQLDRVPGYELGGREFESLRARHFFEVVRFKATAGINSVVCNREV